MLGQSGGLSLLSGAVPWLVAALVPWGPGAFLDPVQTPVVAREGVQEPEKGSRSHLVATVPSRSHPASLRRWDLKERRERGEPRSNINQTHQSPGIWRKWHRI